jgi:TRAP-type C4-dicarboxylate transport system substrate-binding protein
MRVKRFPLIVMSALLVVGMGLSFAPAQAAPKSKPIVLKAISFLPASNARTVVYRKWMDAVTERAKGELTMKYIGGPEVIAYPQQPQAIRKGVVDLSFCGASRFKGLVPEARMMALSLQSWEEERKSGAEDLMRKYFAKSGIYFVGRADPKQNPKNFSIYLKKKIASPDDLKGLRLGAAGTYVDAMAKALGMSMTIIKSSDAYSALDRGMIDAYSFSLEGAKSYSLQEVVPYVLDHPLYRSNTNLPMNLAKWKKLPPHLQKLIMDVYEEFVPVFIKASAKGLIDAKKVFQKAGVKFITFSPSDAERFISIAYGAEAQKYLKEIPGTAPEYLKLVGAIK